MGQRQTEAGGQKTDEKRDWRTTTPTGSETCLQHGHRHTPFAKNKKETRKKNREEKRERQTWPFFMALRVLPLRSWASWSKGGSWFARTLNACWMEGIAR
eukprot:1096299-Rhodomonas_salina.3